MLDFSGVSRWMVSNPNIGYGVQTITYAGGSAKEFCQIGLSANTTGISVYVMGIKDAALLGKLFVAPS